MSPYIFNRLFIDIFYFEKNTYIYSFSANHISITRRRNKKKRAFPERSVIYMHYFYSIHLATRQKNWISCRVYRYTSLFSLAACNIGNALGECAVILSGILCSIYLHLSLQTSSTSFHRPPLISCSFFLPPHILCLSSPVERNSIRRAEWRHQNISILISLPRPALLNPRA